MDAELVYLATTSASGLIQAVATDGWQAARRGVSALWHRWHPAKVALIEAQVDDAHEQLATAAPEDVAEITRALEATWAASLSALLRTAPEAADDLRRLAAARFVVDESGSQRIGDVRQEAIVDHGISFQAGGNITVADSEINREP